MTKTAKARDLNQGKLKRDLSVRRVGRFGLWTIPILTYIFLWIPILVLIIYSFNNAESVSVWRGFTLRWYQNLLGGGADGLNFQSELLLNAVRNSLIVGAISTVASTVIGTLFALAVDRGDFPGKRVFDALFYLPVIIPDITQGVALAVFFNTFFALVQNVFGVRLVSGFSTIIIAHIAFNIAYVAVVVRARLATMDSTLEEAARDLGANHLQTFWHITFPALVPGILGGALLAFTISLDDFVVTFFTAGVGTTTLPLFVYGLLKQRVPPEINAVSALMIAVSILLVGVSLVMQRRGNDG